MNLRNFLAQNREVLQLVYGVILIILIPLLIAINTISIIEKYNENLDVSLQRHALTVGRSIYALIKDDLNNKDALQNKIETLSSKNLELQNLEILVPEKDSFKAIASSNKENIEKYTDSSYYKFAWMQPDNDGLATDSLKLVTQIKDKEFVSDKDKEFISDFPEKKRFWLVAMPMTDSSGEKRALLTIRMSSEIVDELTDYNRNTSIYLLITTILIVILFLSITIRIWDYAILYKKIKEVDQMKDEFISMASHELRTPLGAIKGYISLILEGTFGEIKNKEMKKSLNRIMISAKKLGDLVEDLLDVSRIEQGRLQMDIKKIEIEPIIENVIEQLSVSAEEKKLDLKYEKPKEKLPKINADPERLSQVLINLIGNSIKYTEKGSVSVSIKTNNNKAEIEIIDTGIGMSAEEQKRLFEKFYRIKNNETKKVSGTGLGLWITKQIIDLMKGKIYIESMKEAGTRVTIMLNVSKK